jgi:Thymidylate synthase complementing protein
MEIDLSKLTYLILLVNQKKNMLSTKDFKINFLGINPVIIDDTGGLDPQSICALGALLTFKGTSAENLKKQALEKGQDMKKKVHTILMNSSLKGHASMATTPVFSFSYEASKMIDSALTGMVFSSSLMASGRRTDSTYDDIVYPVAISGNPQALALYQSVSQQILDAYHQLLEAKVEKDQTSKLLQYGVYGTGIISYSVESFNTLKREYDREKNWMPEEIGFFIQAIEAEFEKMGVADLFKSRRLAPRTAYPYPNIFKNPETINLAREIAADKLEHSESEIIAVNSLATENLHKKMDDLRRDLEAIYADKATMLKNWYKAMEKRAEIARDYQNVLDIKLISRLSWRVWGETKRHRTMPQTVDSIYFAINRAVSIWGGLKKNILSGDLNKEQVEQLDSALCIPLTIHSTPENLALYTQTVLAALEAYVELIKLGIAERDAIFVIPRAVRIDVLQDINFYNLISGYFPLRLCSTADEQLRRVTRDVAAKIETELTKNKLSWLNWHIEPKCYATGFCPEKNSCWIIKKAVKNYDEKFHEELKEHLEKLFAAEI